AERDRVGGAVGDVADPGLRIHVVDARKRGPREVHLIARVHLAVTAATAEVVGSPDFVAVVGHVENVIGPDVAVRGGVVAGAVNAPGKRARASHVVRRAPERFDLRVGRRLEVARAVYNVGGDARVVEVKRGVVVGPGPRRRVGVEEGRGDQLVDVVL